MNERIRKILIYYVKHSSEEDAARLSVVVRNEKFAIIELDNYLCDEESTEEEGDCEHDVSGFGLVDVLVSRNENGSVYVKNVYQHTEYVSRNAALYLLNLYEFSALFEKKHAYR